MVKLVKKGKIHFHNTINDRIGESISSVYKGKYYEDGYTDASSKFINVAVKKVELRNPEENTAEDELRTLRHPNVVELYYVTYDKKYRYYAFELCGGSLKDFFHHSEKASPIYPDATQVFLQLAEGLKHIHTKIKMAHCDIKPDNVLVSFQNGDVTMKWSDFGLSKPLKDGEFTLSKTGRGTRGWIAPEIFVKKPSQMSRDELRISLRSDIWSTGCVFFYYLTRGQHYPFGKLTDDEEIREYARKGDPFKITEYQTEPEVAPFRVLIREMVELSPEKRITVEDILNELKGNNRETPKIRVSLEQLSPPVPTTRRNPVYDYGPNDKSIPDIVVYRGIFGNSQHEAAIKKIPEIFYPLNKDGERVLLSLSHPNIVPFLHAENLNYDPDFYGASRLFAFERCSGSMDQLFLPKNNPRFLRVATPPTEQVLLSLIQGLEYIHSKKLKFGRIKPENILISTSSQPVTMQWADFGLTDPETKDMPRSSEIDRWIAPEVLETMERLKTESESRLSPKVYESSIWSRESDIWSLGAVFYYYLTKGENPLEVMGPFQNNRHLLQHHAIELKRMLPKQVLELTDDRYATEVVSKMLTFEPPQRIFLMRAIEKLRNNLQKVQDEQDMIQLCSWSNPLQDDVDKLCNLFRKEGINLSWSSNGDETPQTLLCYSLIYGMGHGPSLNTLLQVMEEKMYPKMKLSDIQYRGSTLFHELCRNYQDSTHFGEIIKRLDRDDLLSKDPKGNYGLHLILGQGYQNEDSVDIIQTFIDAGFNGLNEEDPDGRHPFNVFCRYFRSGSPISVFIAILDKFVDNGLDVNAKDRYGDVPLLLLCQYYKNENLTNIIDKFMERGFDINKAKDNKENSALHVLCQHYKNENLIEIVGKFLSKLDDVHRKDSSISALLGWCENYTMKSNLTEMVQIFIDECGFDVNCTKDAKGSSALHIICSAHAREQNKNIENLMGIIQQFIVCWGFDVNGTKDSDENTVLHLLDHVEIIRAVEMLQNNGITVDLNVKNRYGTSLLNELCQYKIGHSHPVPENEGKDLLLDQVISKWVTCYGVVLDLVSLELVCKHYCRENLVNVVQVFTRDRPFMALCKSEHLNKVLFALCKHYKQKNMAEIIKELEKHGANLKARDGSGNKTGIHYICENYGVKEIELVIKLFIDAKADFGAIDVFGKTALHHLCENYKKENILDIIQLILSSDNSIDDINGKDTDGKAAIEYLCQNYPIEEELFQVAQFFVQKMGCNENREVVRRCLQTNKNVRDSDGHISNLFNEDSVLLPLRQRSTERTQAIAEVIRRREIQHLYPGEGPVTLHLLCGVYKKENLYDIIKDMIDAGLDLNAKDEERDTAAHVLFENCKSEDLLRITKYLFRKESGVQINAKNSNGTTVLHLLCRYYDKANKLEIIQTLIELGAQPNDRNIRGDTALHILCSCYHEIQITVIRGFLDIIEDVDVYAVDKSGRTALHLLCEKYCGENLDEVAQLLIAKGLNPSTKDITKKKNTPLHLLCESYHNEKVLISTLRLFLNNGLCLLDGYENWIALYEVISRETKAYDIGNELAIYWCYSTLERLK